ncbi:MAG: type II CRISPR-associated endonuclease Cas1 [Sphaerochaetaceae bacterium]|nr:type II CRISPR-associated endonuclease Cas1 [Sphaerochaetaceae bacterium]
MSWRIVVISQRAKLELKLNYMVIRGETETKVFIDEISMLIIENTAVSLTCALLHTLTERKVKVVFCDTKRNPSSELVSLYGSHDTSSRIRNQIKWETDFKRLVWMEIVKEKIRKQAFILGKLALDEAQLLYGYIEQVEPGDPTNREGHAAKVYFNALWGKSFSRAQDNFTNAALNYGYAMILSVFNREIVANGYLTQLGLFHDNMFNFFNLSSDMMEPFRPLIDMKVYYLPQFDEFSKDEKFQLLEVLNQTVYIDSSIQYVTNAIKIYCKSILDALEAQDISLIKLYNNEF